MNIFVFVKHVPDTEARIKIDSSGKNIATADITFMDSPYDEFAVEQALLLAEASEGSVVTAVTIGPEEAKQLLRDNLAKGVNEVAHINSDKYGQFDALTTAKIIAAFLKDKEYDLILFGNKAYGADNSLVPSMVAGLLDIAQVNLVTKMDISGTTVKAERQVEGMTEMMEASMPCVISAQKGLNEPRMKSLKGIMAAKKKEIASISVGDVIPESELAMGIEVLSLQNPPAKEGGKKFEGEPADAATELFNYMREEIKIV
jgi:electron transfer flavoprotein beta subunit